MFLMAILGRVFDQLPYVCMGYEGIIGVPIEHCVEVALGDFRVGSCQEGFEMASDTTIFWIEGLKR